MKTPKSKEPWRRWKTWAWRYSLPLTKNSKETLQFQINQFQYTSQPPACQSTPVRIIINPKALIIVKMHLLSHWKNTARKEAMKLDIDPAECMEAVIWMLAIMAIPVFQILHRIKALIRHQSANTTWMQVPQAYFSRKLISISLNLMLIISYSQSTNAPSSKASSLRVNSMTICCLTPISFQIVNLISYLAGCNQQLGVMALDNK